LAQREERLAGTSFSKAARPAWCNAGNPWPGSI